jgi:hypothetical protein
MYAHWRAGDDKRRWVLEAGRLMKKHAKEHSALSPGWGVLLLGQIAQRVCPYARGGCPESKCRFAHFCRCARHQEQAANRLETRFWVLLAGCSAGAILYWFLAE